MGRIHLSRPHMGETERDRLIAAFDSNWIAPAGPELPAFEREFAEFVGVSHAVALASGTAALHLALIGQGVAAGDRVYLSDLTFVASANAIRYVGADPVFIDSELSSWNLDPQLVAQALEEDARNGQLPKAVLAVDILGQCARYDELEAICAEYEVPIIEDAAEALGATFKGRNAGQFGRLAAFSFNGNKIITTSGGGMLVSEDSELIERARYLSTQAREPVAHYEHLAVGFNYRMSNLLAAIGRGQLEVLKSRVDARRRINAFYRQALDVAGITFMPELEGATSTFWLTAITIDEAQFGCDREAVRKHLISDEIEARPMWKPMSMQPVFADCQCVGGEVGASIFESGLCLPSGSDLTDGELDRVVERVLGVRK